MNRLCVLALAGAVLLSGLGVMKVMAAEKAPGTVTVFNLGALDEAGVKNLEAYLAMNIALPVRVATVKKVNEIDDALEAVAKNRKAGDAIVIALAPIAESGAISLVDADHALALVNTEALAHAAKSPLRVNLAVMRALAASLGVGNSLDPHCVYRMMETPAEYDKLGGNFSPPTLQQVLMSASAHGVAPNVPTRRQAPAPKK